MSNPINVLLLTGIGLALMYAVVSFTAPEGASGAFVFAAGAGAGLFALVVVLLAAAGLWQSHAYKKMQ